MKKTAQKSSTSTSSSFLSSFSKWSEKRMDVIVLFFVFLYYSIDLLQRGFNRFEIVNLQFLVINGVNLLSSLFIFINKVSFESSIKRLVKKNYLLFAYLTFIIFCGLSFFVAPNKSLAIYSFTQILLVCIMTINLSLLLFKRLHLIYTICLIVAFVGFFQAAIVLSQLRSFTDSEQIRAFLDSSVLEGNAGNMNIMSSGLLLKIPFAVIALYHYTGIKRLFLAIALFSMFFCIFIINQRTAILTFPFLLVTFAFYFFKLRAHYVGAIKRVAFIVLPIIFSFLIANVILSNSGRSGRFESTAARLSQINIAESSTQARLWFWQNGMELIKSNPALGIGIGNWMVEQIPLGKNRYVFSMNAHNDFVEVAAETGVINGFVFLSIFALLFLGNYKSVKFENKLQQTIAFLCLSLFFVYAIDSFINFPLHRPTMQVGFAMLMAYTFINRNPFVSSMDSKSENPRNLYTERIATPFKAYLIVILLSASTIYITWYANKTSLLDYMVVKHERDGAEQILSADEVANWSPKIPNVSRQTSISFDEYTGILYFKEKNYDAAIQYLDRGMAIHGKLGRENYQKYLIAEERRMADSAYYYLEQTFRQAPFYEGWYNQFIRYAGRRKDTTVILQAFSEYITAARKPHPSTFETTIHALRAAGYPYEKVLSFAEQAIVDFPADSASNVLLNSMKITQLLVEGQRFVDDGNDKKALEKFTEAVGIDSTNVFAQQNLAIYYYNHHDYLSAIPHFKRSLQKPGLSDGLTEYLLGISLFETQNKNEGCHFVKLAIYKGHKRAEAYFKQHCE